MKKLMIAAAIVSAAALSQAASFTWATGSVGAIGADDLAAGLAAGKTYAADAVMNDIDTAGWTVQYQLILSYGGSTDTLSGTLATDMFSGSIYDTLSSDLVAAGRDIDYTLTLTANVTDGQGATWDVTSNVMSGLWHADESGDIGFSYGEASSWSTAAVPEPTSGLLLLLGVAGLALRRRRA